MQPGAAGSSPTAGMVTIAEMFTYSEWTEVPCTVLARCSSTVACGTYFFAALLIYIICCRRPASITTLLLLSRI